MIKKSYLFGAIKYQKVGSISLVIVFGMAAYMRVGDAKCFLGIAW